MKAACAVLCIVCFVAAAVSGAGVISLLAADAYGGGDYFGTMAREAMGRDMSRVLYDYFDPEDPANPWERYNSGGIFTGKDSNFIYRIVDSETGEVVLATYSGTPEVRVSDSCVGELELQVAADVEITQTELPDVPTELTEPVFRCAGILYAYDWQSKTFGPVEGDIADYMETVTEEPADLLFTGFLYDGRVYRYIDGTFVSDFAQDSPSAYGYAPHLYTIDAYLLSGLPYEDAYRELFDLTGIVYSMRYLMIWLLAGGLLLGISLLVLLCRGADHRNGTEELALHPICRIPTDVALAVVCALGLLLLLVGLRITYALLEYSLWGSAALGLTILICCVTLGVYTVVMLAARGKLGVLGSGTLIGWTLRHLGRLVGRVLRYLPLLWKVIACFAVICLAELFLLAWGDAPFEVGILWLLEHLALGALVCYAALAFRRLKTGAEAISAGDYAAQVSKRYLVLDFADTADTLNHIQDGMNDAVESRMRSERMKTDLIANVSHDLKTPLTSIVSYVDLLKQELDTSEGVSDSARDYIGVLERQSDRLKKLIEDLVEASKASSGTLNLQMEPLDFGMLLGQALGEYTQRITDAGLTPVTRLPETPIQVMADGRRLWRVFDNLLGNAVKYAMPGTRMYLQVDAGEREVTATFRNISREPLSVDAEELMERFVRGDASRHTEGSGLGLSIARSLTESMGGRFDLDLDGDLFKAAVTLPRL